MLSKYKLHRQRKINANIFVKLFGLVVGSLTITHSANTLASALEQYAQSYLVTQELDNPYITQGRLQALSNQNTNDIQFHNIHHRDDGIVRDSSVLYSTQFLDEVLAKENKHKSNRNISTTESLENEQGLAVSSESETELVDANQQLNSTAFKSKEQDRQLSATGVVSYKQEQQLSVSNIVNEEQEKQVSATEVDEKAQDRQEIIYPADVYKSDLVKDSRFDLGKGKNHYVAINSSIIHDSFAEYEKPIKLFKKGKQTNIITKEDFSQNYLKSQVQKELYANSRFGYLKDQDPLIERLNRMPDSPYEQTFFGNNSEYTALIGDLDYMANGEFVTKSTVLAHIASANQLHHHSHGVLLHDVNYNYTQFCLHCTDLDEDEQINDFILSDAIINAYTGESALGVINHYKTMHFDEILSFKDYKASPMLTEQAFENAQELCLKLNDANSCFFAANYSIHNKMYRQTINYAQKGCELKSQPSCLMLSNIMIMHNEYKKGYTQIEKMLADRSYINMKVLYRLASNYFSHGLWLAAERCYQKMCFLGSKEGCAIYKSINLYRDSIGYDSTLDHPLYKSHMQVITADQQLANPKNCMGRKCNTEILLEASLNESDTDFIIALQEFDVNPYKEITSISLDEIQSMKLYLQNQCLEKNNSFACEMGADLYELWEYRSHGISFELLNHGCTLKNARACQRLADIHAKNMLDSLAKKYMQRACDLGFSEACLGSANPYTIFWQDIESLQKGKTNNLQNHIN